jgi:hypothetical protein
MIGPLIVAGRVGAREVGFTITRTRDGQEIVRTYTGPVADVVALGNSTFPGASSVQVRQQPGSALATCDVRYAFAPGDTGGSGQEITEEVTCQYSSVPIPIKQHAYFGNLPIDGIITIDNAIAANADFPAGGAGLDADTRWEEYYLLRRLGVNEFEAKLPVVRYTIRCTPQYAGILDTDGVGLLFFREEMLNRISTPKFFNPVEPRDVFLGNAYGYFLTGWRLDAVLSFDTDGNGVLEEVYTWGQFAQQLYSFTTRYSSP